MSVEPTGFLYPFIDGEETEREALLEDLARSARSKASESEVLCAATLERWQPALSDLASEVGERLERGGCLFSFGNGGSATDADLLADLFASPPHGRPLRARSLSSDDAVLTALGNDVGFDLVFQRQLIAYARPGDVAVGLSTSGNSENLLRAFAEARARAVLTIGVAGYDGGRMSHSSDVDSCLVVPSESVHRIQEAEARLCFELWRRVQGRLSEPPQAS